MIKNHMSTPSKIGFENFPPNWDVLDFSRECTVWILVMGALLCSKMNELCFIILRKG